MELNENAKILLFSEAEGCQIQIFKGPDVLKSEIDFDNIKLEQHSCFSKELGQEMKSKVAVLNDQKCFAVWFDDGSIYEFGRGRWREDHLFDKEWTLWLWNRFQDKPYKRKKSK